MQLSKENENKLFELINKYRDNKKYYKENPKSFPEFECRLEYIDIFLKLLGWDVENTKCVSPAKKEVVVEHFADDNNKDKPDYTLTLRGISKFFVEAKKPSVDISKEKEPSFQARRYGWNAGHKIVVLTNFEYLMIYECTYAPNINDGANVALFRKYYYEEYLEKFEEISEIISRDSIYSGHFEELTNQNFKDTRTKLSVDEYFLEQINKWRVELANHLYLQNKKKYSNAEILNDETQRFINQIVFLRICEDKNLPLYHSLKNNIRDTKTLKQELNRMFKEADKRYNSGLFKDENILFDLNNDIIMKMINELYYPQSPYLFNIIEPNLLGKMYEMFLTEEFQIIDNKVVLLTREECINRSVVKTPDEIVKYIVENTLKPLCLNKTPQEILKIKIADISCGSGIFLEEAMNFLNEYCIEWYKENHIEYLEKTGPEQYKLPLTEKKKILTSCIYGIDIDIHAVEVSKFSLLIKLIEDENIPTTIDVKPILPDLDENIKFGNSLIEKEDINSVNITLEDETKIKAFDWNLINKGEKFDAIIGNPPYVCTEDMHNLLSELEFEIYLNKFKTPYKQFDKYYLFIEQALKKIKDNGYVSYIVTNKFYKIVAGRKLREYIAENNYLMSLIDFGSNQLFEDKTTYSAIITLSKKNNSKFEYAEVKNVSELWTENYKKIYVDISNITSEPWILSTDKNFINMTKKLKDDNVTIPITDIVDITAGIQTSANGVYIFDKSELIEIDEKKYKIIRNGKTYYIEKNILRKFFKIKGLTTYENNIYADKYIIFPYNKEGILYTEEEMNKYFRGTFQYLTDNYEKLSKRKMNITANINNWYQYGRVQHLRTFNKPKLICGVLSKPYNPSYMYDTENMLIEAGGTAGRVAIFLKDTIEAQKYDLLYIQAWLNHPYTEKILSVLGSDFESGFFSRGQVQLSQLRFVKLDFNNLNHKNLHDNVVQKAKQIQEINNKLTEEYLSREVRKLLESKRLDIKLEIEELIKKVYLLEI
ncbi:MAG: restriction endonuclease subunit M [Clostridia bacterium]|nr:restriction endonuclease subunit M [Clostridia bacterium]